jgi:hypothetical protein
MGSPPVSPTRLKLDASPEDFDGVKAALLAADEGGVVTFTFGEKVLVVTRAAVSALTVSDSAGRRKGDILQETQFNRVSRSLQQHYNELKAAYCEARGGALGVKSGDILLGVWTSNFGAFFKEYVDVDQGRSGYYYAEPAPARFEAAAKDWWEEHWLGVESRRAPRDRVEERRVRQAKKRSNGYSGTSTMMTEGVTED